MATNLDHPRQVLQAYRRMMWIEEMFGDWKGHGFDLQLTQLRDPERLSRLTLAVALLYVWLLRTGQRVIQQGHRAWVNRPDRRDLSLFQIGRRWLERLVSHQQPFQIHLRPAPPGKLSSD